MQESVSSGPALSPLLAFFVSKRSDRCTNQKWPEAGRQDEAMVESRFTLLFADLRQHFIFLRDSVETVQRQLVSVSSYREAGG
jgi:hypothetical protein